MQHQRTIAILTYHSLDDSGSVLSTPPRVFAEQMRILNELDLKVVSLGDVRRALDDASPPKPLVAITFDDGFQSVYEHAIAVLHRYGFPATVFLVTDYSGRTNAWPGQPLSIKRLPLLRWAEIQEMSKAGIAFGSHTRTHPDLRTITRREAEDELIGSKKKIEDAISLPVDTLAYPYGACGDVVRNLATMHFNLACSATLGFAGPESDPFALKRLDMYYLRYSALFQRLFSPGAQAYIGYRRFLRDLRHLVYKHAGEGHAK